MPPASFRFPQRGRPLKIRNYHWLTFAIAGGAFVALGVLRFSSDHKVFWPAVSGFAVIAVGFLRGPKARQEITLEEDSLLLKDGDRITRIAVAEIVSYQIRKITSLSLELHLKDGAIIGFPLESVGSLAGVRKFFNHLAIPPAAADSPLQNGEGHATGHL